MVWTIKFDQISIISFFLQLVSRRKFISVLDRIGIIPRRFSKISGAYCRRIWSCCDQTLACVCKTWSSSEIVAFVFLLSLSIQVMSQSRRSAHLTARFQSARSSTFIQSPQSMTIDLTNTESISDEFFPMILSSPRMICCRTLHASSVIYFHSSGSLSCCVLQCCPLSIHLQCVTDLVHLSWIVPSATLSPLLV